jgi:hypothetical protein
MLAEKRARQVKAAQEFEREKLEKKRRDFEEQERINEEKQRQADIALFAKMQADKIHRNDELRVQLEKEREDQRKAKQTSDDEIRRRLDNIEKMNAEKANAARLSHSDSAVRSMQRAEEYQKKLADRQRGEAKKRYRKQKKSAISSRECGICSSNCARRNRNKINCTWSGRNNSKPSRQRRKWSARQSACGS